MSVTIDKVKHMIDECRDEVDAQIIDNRSRIETVHHTVDDIERKLDKLDRDVNELLVIFRAFNGFLTVGSWFGKFIRWAVGVGIAIAAVIAYMKGFKP